LAFAGRCADTIITDASSVEAMKDYREGVRRRARAAGRDPDSIKVLFLAYPLVDTTMDSARERQHLMREDANRHLDLALSTMSRLTNIDFSRFDPDQPIPELFTNGDWSSLAKWIGKTPRDVTITSHQGRHRFHRHDRPRRQHHAGDYGRGRRRRFPVLQCDFRPALRQGNVRWVGAGIAAPRTDTNAIRSQTPQGQPAGILAVSRGNNTWSMTFAD